MKVMKAKGRMWEIEWKEHIIKAESLKGDDYSGPIYPYRLYFDGKLLDKGNCLHPTLTGTAKEDNNTTYFVTCDFGPRREWWRWLMWVRPMKSLIDRIYYYIRDELLFTETIEIDIKINGQLIYSSLFGTQEEIQKLNEELSSYRRKSQKTNK